MGKTIQLYGFPSGVLQESVKAFVERFTGEGSIDAINVKRSRGRGKRLYAIIQFIDDVGAKLIISLANASLRYGTSYLKAREWKQDILQDPLVFEYNFKGLELHLGCQISREEFFVLWRESNVSVNFEFERRDLKFFISHPRVDYMLVLRYENIWQVELHKPQGQSIDYLLIQLVGAPRIYERDTKLFGHISEDPFLSFSKEMDTKWFRATDFTPSCCIGQSGALCLEIPYGRLLPNFHDKFAYFNEIKGKFTLASGSTYSSNVNLVPVVRPPLSIHLPYAILFKINLLVQQGCLPGPSLDISFYEMVDPQIHNIAFIDRALRKLYDLKECCYNPSKWLGEEYRKYSKLTNPPQPPNLSLDEGLVYVHRVQVTPCRVYFCGPEVNVSNRVLRRYPEYLDNFLRVSFVDEELDKLYSTELSPRESSSLEDGKTKIFKRILSVLKDGITIGDKKFEFLAYSSSQLRENAVWMFAPRDGITAAKIRKWMGDFHSIRNVAKYAARLGQSFGSSTETASVSRREVKVIPDIEVKSDAGINYVFSDGIGKISASFAREVARKCHIRHTPSAFQIRYAGFKGVISVDPTSFVKLSLRNSMLKYESTDTKLDVLSWSRYHPCYLNRQLITLLSTLGVQDDIFESKQKELIDQLDTIFMDPLKAQQALELMSPGENTNILKEIISCGYRPDSEPFLYMMLHTFRESKLLELRRKSRIFIPNGRAMMGCLDETGNLEYGEVFVQCSAHQQLHNDHIIFKRSKSNQHFIVTGTVVVAKNPCLHPGDVRVLTAVDVPSLHHMVDCLVFPQKGPRPHPNECSGSDLDGDIYFVCWDPDLIPPQQVEPMDYTPVPSRLLDHDVTMEEVQEYFANYMVNDSLGIIANAHTAFADSRPEKAMSEPCIKLAKLFSIAVDFPKTGVPALISADLRVQVYPDFMDKPDKQSYKSHNVLGKLFRMLDDIEPRISIKSVKFTREIARQAYDPDMEVKGFEEYLDDALYHKNNYDMRLGNLMKYYKIKTEAELISGVSLTKSSSFTKKNEAESIIMAVKSLRKEARGWFNENAGLHFGHDNNAYARASAWYFVTYHYSYWGWYGEKNESHFLSFPWCVYDKLIRIKKRKIGARARHR
ncbi:RNA-dependent RNA polymerase 1-like [Cucurbita moschata]|uniref:RNA-dependent RNA polymerase n=1 Tax=Cucurbita moschata TaxID=3662 RepID=A0A6J1FR02_CUCMO|nr:RNA-dependent RNA polymerase 1-like [Cucurbita moschata]